MYTNDMLLPLSDDGTFVAPFNLQIIGVSGTGANGAIDITVGGDSIFDTDNPGPTVADGASATARPANVNIIPVGTVVTASVAGADGVALLHLKKV